MRNNLPKWMRAKLPKQWRHWCRAAGLKPTGTRWLSCDHRESWRWYYLEGKGYFWKVNCFGMFQIEGSYKNYNRSGDFEFVEFNIPYTKEEFLSTINLLIKMKETNENLSN